MTDKVCNWVDDSNDEGDWFLIDCYKEHVPPPFSDYLYYIQEENDVVYCPYCGKVINFIESREDDNT